MLILPPSVSSDVFARLRARVNHRWASSPTLPRHREPGPVDSSPTRTTPQPPTVQFVPSDHGRSSFIGQVRLDGTLVEAHGTPGDAADLNADDAIGGLFWQASWWSWSPVVQQRVRSAIERASLGEVVRYDETLRLRGNRLATIDVRWSPVVEADIVTALVCSAIMR